MEMKAIKTLVVTAIILIACTLAVSGESTYSENAVPQYAHTTDTTDDLSKTIWQTEYATSYRSNGTIVEYTIEKNLSGEMIVDKAALNSVNDLTTSKTDLSIKTKPYNSISAHFILNKSTGIGDVSLDFMFGDIQTYSDDIRMKVELDANKSLKTAQVYENSEWKDLSKNLSIDEVEQCVLPFIVIGGLALAEWLLLGLVGGYALISITWDKLSESTDKEAEETGKTKGEHIVIDDIRYITMDNVPTYIYVDETVGEAISLNTDNLYKSKAKAGDYFFVVRYMDDLFFSPIILNESQAKEIIWVKNANFNTWTPYYYDAAELCIDNARYIHHGTPHQPNYFVHCHIYKDTSFRDPNNPNDDHWPSHSFYGLPNGGMYNP